MPEPEPSAETGQSAGLTLSGGYDQARSIALRFVRAVRDADEVTLETLLSDPVYRSPPRHAQTPIPRTDVLTALANSARDANLGPDTPLEQLLRLDDIQVLPLEEYAAGQAVPAGLDPNDLVVSFTLEALGRTLFQPMMHFGSRVAIIVRPGAAPLVLAVG